MYLDRVNESACGRGEFSLKGSLAMVEWDGRSRLILAVGAFWFFVEKKKRP